VAAQVEQVPLDKAVTVEAVETMAAVAAVVLVPQALMRQQRIRLALAAMVCPRRLLAPP
jgi:hypothetical protein